MCKFNPKNDSRRIDPCMVNLIEFIEENSNTIEVLACCCGHGKYNMSIVIMTEQGIFDLISNVEIPRKKRFYKKDKQGVYYIPEVLNETNKNSNSNKIL